jgi:hypothetical protein
LPIISLTQAHNFHSTDRHHTFLLLHCLLYDETCLHTSYSTVWKKYDSYELETDPKQDDRAVEFKLSKFGRPHMRSFYVSTFSFFSECFLLHGVYCLRD